MKYELKESKLLGNFDQQAFLIKDRPFQYDRSNKDGRFFFMSSQVYCVLINPLYTDYSGGSKGGSRDTLEPPSLPLRFKYPMKMN